MILAIDTIDRAKIKLTLINDKTECFDTETSNQSADILIAIDNILKKQNLTLKDLKGILVNQGPGSYTGVRVGIVVANALAWSLDIPVIGHKEGEVDAAIETLKSLKDNHFSALVLPFYPE